MSVRPLKKGRGCFFALSLTLVLSMLFCCCLSGLLVAAASDSQSSRPLLENPFEAIARPREILGMALTPATLSPLGAKNYGWNQAEARFEIGYGLSTKLRDEAERQMQALAKRFRYQQTAGNGFDYSAPSSCEDQPWGCIYHEVARANLADLEALISLFQSYQQTHKLNARQTVEFVMSFVQSIEYRVPTESPFGLLPPALVLTDGNGDCDSKSLLGAMILERMGIDCVILFSDALEHAALGVSVPATGQSFSYAGVKYFYVESTNTGWGIGQMPPDKNKTKSWKVVPFDL
jgi:hypothetical protein